ncbi:hypothetical protein [Paraburkholderia dipogonis]|uniref:hypothetical protein n=1 Tax=Paraburkholderia dipogonis TaxID=1211383 RepID=UPI0038B99E89
MRKSLLLKALLFAAFPMFAVEGNTAGATPSNADAAQEHLAQDAQSAPGAEANADPAADNVAPAADAPTAPEVEPEAPVASDASQAPADGAPVDTGEGDSAAASPVVQTPTPVAQSGDAGDPVLETVKTPAHNVADEIQEQIKKLEELPAEVAAWFESKFIELAGHIKALL